MSERENILGRVREALRTPASAGGHAPAAPPDESLPGVGDYARVLPATGNSLEENLALFQRNAAELRADFRTLPDRTALPGALAALARDEQWKKVAAHRAELTAAALAGCALPVCWTDAGYDPQELAACDAGISECDALVAHTGSAVVSSRSAGGRALSVLPPHHLILARSSQLVGGLPEAFALLKARYRGGYPSMISFITGPSRTGDIERILVLGAHGPKKLTIFCLLAW